MCYIDASKAFDHVHFWCLFDKLIKRKVHIILVQFLYGMVLYKGICCNVAQLLKYNIHCANGVRQGGILSPLFFTVYMDDLSNSLNDAKVGCSMDGVIINRLMYADDLFLIPTPISAMQILLNCCDSFARNHDVLYSTRKSVCMFLRLKCFKSSFVPCLRLSGSVLRCVSSYK